MADSEKQICYIISFDAPAEARQKLTEAVEAIKAYGTWAHITESTWAVVTSKNHKEIRDDLLSLLPETARLFVLRSGSVAAWSNVRCRNEWLKRYL